MSRFGLIFVALTAMWLMVESGSGQIVAFPGAEGYGRFATGGRGKGDNGRVAIVTNLEDDVNNPPEGSFRWALKQGVEVIHNPIIGDITVEQPLTVVFEVSGVIELKGELRINRNNITIAGQTAPGSQGIVIRGYGVNFGGSKNIILRYLRFRPGDENDKNNDAFRLENGGNFIIDHCSFSWAIEETVHTSANRFTTLQWCIISESLYNSIHHKGARGYATQWGGEYASYHHNLLAHHSSRMPRINGSSQNDVEALVDYRNNVNYNWGRHGSFYGGEWENTAGQGFCHTNVVNNYFIPGPATPPNPIFLRPSLNRSGIPLDGYAKWHVSGNVMVGNEDLTMDNRLGIDVSEVGSLENIFSEEILLKTIDIEGAAGDLENYDTWTQTAEEAYTAVLDGAGATLPRRDDIDERIVAEVRGDIPILRYAYAIPGGQNSPILGLTSGLIDTQMNLIPENEQDSKSPWDIYKTVTSNSAPLDSDRDGIPDAWEIANGLDPKDPTDARQICQESAYSFLELYLNDLVSGDWTSSVENAAGVKNSGIVILTQRHDPVIHFYADAYVLDVNLYDITGNKMLSQQVNGYSGQLNLSGFGHGVFLLMSRMIDGNTVIQKVMK